MGKYILSRVIQGIFIFLIITLVVYVLSCMAPGSVVDIITSSNVMTQEAYEAAVEKYNLDKPIIVRYGMWLSNFLHGNWGTSTFSNKGVWATISVRIGPTLVLTLTALALAVIVAIPIGVMAACKPHSIWDNLSTVLAFIGASVPNFFIGIVLVYFFACKLKILPATGMYSSTGGGGFVDLLRHLAMPVFVLSIQNIGNFIKQTRSSMLEVMNAEYVRTARQKGLSESKVIVKHVLRNAWIPIVTSISLTLPTIIGGAVITEQIFGWPGLGSLMITAINNRDYDLIMGITVLIAIVVLVVNILIDILYTKLDPRIRT